jgi:hypothetical protein
MAQDIKLTRKILLVDAELILTQELRLRING